MPLLSLVSWLLRRRLRQSWLLLAVTSFGILASVTIMATGPCTPAPLVKRAYDTQYPPTGPRFTMYRFLRKTGP